MAITYPVDTANTKWAVLNTDTGEILARNKTWPTADGSEIVGLASNIVYLLHVTDAQPDYDSRLYVMTSTEVVDAPNNQLRRTYAAQKRPTEEQLTAAENVEVEQMRRHVKLEKEAIETRLMLAAVLHHLDGLTLPPKMQAMADDYKAKGVKIWKNRDRLKAIKADITNGIEPDMDAGWEAPDA